MRAFSVFQKRKSTPTDGAVGIEALSLALGKRAAATARQSYFSYLFAVFRGTSPYALWERARTAFAPAIFLSRAFRVLRWIFRFLETSALFLFAAALVLCATPFFLAALLLFIAVAAVDSRRADRRLSQAICEKRVLVLFSPPRHGKTPLATLAATYTLLVVVPTFATKCIDGGRFSFLRAAHRQSDGIILIREYYYFHLARTLLPHAAFCARIY